MCHTSSCSHSPVHHHEELHHHDDHDHHHIPKDIKILRMTFLIIFSFMMIEFIGGYLFKSLTLLADAGHMANDAFSLGLAWLALLLANRAARLSKYIALLNGLSLILIAVWVIIEAIQRLQNPNEIIALPMLVIAVIGLCINLFVAKKMLTADHDNLNVRAAYLHVLADLLGSIVAIIAGLSTWLLGWSWVDSVASLLLSLLVFKSGWQVVKLALLNLK